MWNQINLKASSPFANHPLLNTSNYVWIVFVVANTLLKMWNQIDLEAGSPFSDQPLLNASKYWVRIGLEAEKVLLNDMKLEQSLPFDDQLETK